jgi:hypothetical protein
MAPPFFKLKFVKSPIPSQASPPYNFLKTASYLNHTFVGRPAAICWHPLIRFNADVWTASMTIQLQKRVYKYNQPGDCIAPL